MSAINVDKKPEVSIIILNWNGLEDTIECLESLKKITYPDYKLIIVDNGSEGDDVAVLRHRFGSYIHIIENDKNYGFTEGNNIGIRYALKGEAKYILLLNNDTIVDPDFLSNLIEVAAGDTKVGLLGPKIYFYHEPNRIWFAGGKISLFSRSSSRGYNQIDQGQFDKVDCVDFISGSCVLITKRALDSIGFLDPLYFFSLEDVDISLRATRAGFKNVYVPSSKIWHKVFRSGVKNPDIHYYTSRNTFILARKHCRVFPKAVFRAIAATIIELIIYSVRLRNKRALLAMIKGMRDGITLNMKPS